MGESLIALLLCYSHIFGLCVPETQFFCTDFFFLGKIHLRQKMPICQSRAFKESDFDRSYSTIS